MRLCHNDRDRRWCLQGFIMASQTGLSGGITSKSHHICTLALGLLGSWPNLLSVPGVGQVLSYRSGQNKLTGDQAVGYKPITVLLDDVDLGHPVPPLAFLSFYTSLHRDPNMAPQWAWNPSKGREWGGLSSEVVSAVRWLGYDAWAYSPLLRDGLPRMLLFTGEDNFSPGQRHRHTDKDTDTWTTCGWLGSLGLLFARFHTGQSLYCSHILSAHEFDSCLLLHPMNIRW